MKGCTDSNAAEESELVNGVINAALSEAPPKEGRRQRGVGNSVCKRAWMPKLPQTGCWNELSFVVRRRGGPPNVKRVNLG